MNELIVAMMEKADPSQVPGLSRFFKTGPGEYGEGDKFLGIKVPVTRSVVKDHWRNLTLRDLDECMQSGFHEVRLAALLALVEIFNHEKDVSKRSDLVRFYLAHTDRINNWDLVDLSCYQILGQWLMDKDRSLLYDLARSGKTIWEQRIGIVSTMAFIRKGQIEDTFAIADILLHHPHDLVHKAVGWLLREAGKRDKAALEGYLNGTAAEAYFQGTASAEILQGMAPIQAERVSPRYFTMPRTMLRYAIEKFPEEERQSYLNQGKGERERT